ncbi:MAG: HpcH/HpaI aldolase/citrate lyase family protein [Clostridiales bacterium]|nr:HpcH/HpaI aldolase/citrate lyase family protein [Clostridiales bacterium]
MRHHQYKQGYKFVKEPFDFTKDTEKDVLAYCLGAVLYMPATKDFFDDIVSKKYPGLTTMTMCFEDACPEEDVPMAEENVLRILESIAEAKRDGQVSEEDLPLLFLRARGPEQFVSFLSRLDAKHVSSFSGFVFPKFRAVDGGEYFGALKRFNEKQGCMLYGMPILEGVEIALHETRDSELESIKSIVDSYKDYVLNVRVGVTDISSVFGMRRSIDYTIYDILTVRACLSAILNVFGRNNDYVLSGPVWEYFHVSRKQKFKDIKDVSLQHSLLTRNPIVNSAVDGLLREVVLDKANGFIGKTVIHPSHLRYVNALQAVTKEEYEDAVQIVEASGAVMKSASGNKMNEIRPHTNWAQKTIMRAKVYGVVEDETDYLRLFAED